jgi:hypothetical protein
VCRAVLAFILEAVVGLVSLDGLALAAERAKRTVAHRLADTMRHEPRRFVSRAKCPMKLM